MSKTDDILKTMQNAPQNVKFAELVLLCRQYFGKPRNNSTSHQVFRTPWPNDPRVNIQEDKGGKAKAYQVRQVLKAISKLNEAEK